jgi:hypothetical protein
MTYSVVCMTTARTEEHTMLQTAAVPTYGPHRAGTAYALDREAAGHARFGSAFPLRSYPHVIHEGSCSVNGRSTWGYRVTCTGCGAVDATTVGSSVSAEDAPRRFGWNHRDCGPDTTAYVDYCGRIID